MDNFVALSGNVTKDPELRYTASGTAVASFGMAVNRRWKNKQTDEWEERTSFFTVTLWADMAENASQSIEKGSRVDVRGRLEQREYEDKEGNTRKTVEIVADTVALSLKWATASVERIERDKAAKATYEPEPF